MMNFDFVRTKRAVNEKLWQQENNAYEELKCALHQLGWQWTETSAFEIVTNDIAKIWEGIGLVGRQVPLPGEISALTFIVQGRDQKTPSSLSNHPKALANVGGRTSPF